MPETTILDESAVSEIEARLSEFEGFEEAKALCATIRRLRTENESLEADLKLLESAAIERDDLQSQLEQLRTMGARNAQLIDRIRAWSKCKDDYPLDEHINNIATQLEQLRAENAQAI